MAEKAYQVKRLKLKYALDFPVDDSDDLRDETRQLLDNQLRFLDGLESAAERVEGLSATKPEKIHSWLSDVISSDKFVRLNAATPCLWTSADPKKSYLHRVFNLQS